MHVSTHAVRRFTLRVNAVDDPYAGCRAMWRNGRDATEDDLKMFYVQECDDVSYTQSYRVVQHGNFTGLMIVRNKPGRPSCIITILDIPGVFGYATKAKKKR